VEIPTFKPNEAMFYEALRMGRKLALVATFRPSLVSMADELEAMAAAADLEGVQLKPVFVPGAMADAAEGRMDDHDRKIAEAAAQLNDFDCVMLAQFSMARAAPVVQQKLSCPVLTSPGCAVLRLQQSVEVQEE
jgi:Asp/Glu/hydantoin racemase